MLTFGLMCGAFVLGWVLSSLVGGEQIGALRRRVRELESAALERKALPVIWNENEA